MLYGIILTLIISVLKRKFKMKNRNDIVKLAMTTLLALTTTASLMDSANAGSPKKMEKCYGIVKTAMNDCQTAMQSCAGSATKDNQPDAFIFLPEGDCNKIVGGSLTPKKQDSSKK